MKITNDDLLKELSLKELIQLSDLNGRGELSQDVINDAINDALAFVASFINLPANPSQLLIQIGVRLSICELKRKQNFPKDSYTNELKWCEDMLLKMASGKIKSSLDESDKTPFKKHLRAFKHGSERLILKGLNG